MCFVSGSDLSVEALSDYSVEAGLNRAMTNSILGRYSPNKSFLPTSPLDSAEEDKISRPDRCSYLHTSPLDSAEADKIIRPDRCSYLYTYRSDSA